MDSRITLIKSIGDCVMEEELEALLKCGKEVVAYNGFEPSGRLTLAQCLMTVINANKLTKCGCRFILWVADWFAQLNGKLNSDLKKIHNAGLLMVETFKASGMEMNRVDVRWASEEINKHPEKYWTLVMDLAQRFTISRLKRCTPALGRDSKDDDRESLITQLQEWSNGLGGCHGLDGDDVANQVRDIIADNPHEDCKSDTMPLSYMLYATMQVVDIFFLGVDIAQLGKDQLKVNMLAREYAEKMKKKYKPIIISHHLLMGLNGRDKMAKSDPDNAIFMDDPPAEISRKVRQAFCEAGNVEKNPLLEYLQYIWFELRSEFKIERNEENGGDKVYSSYGEVEVDFKDKKLHPGDLKPAMIKALNSLLEPVQRYFEENKEAKELLHTVKSYKLTK